jgi:uridine kinase
LADELVSPIQHLSRPVIQASVDGFHNPKGIRYQQGEYSPKGYYWDSFNYEAVISSLLVPLGPGGDRTYRDEVYNYRIDKIIQSPYFVAPENAVLLMDGVFLHRTALFSFWDITIFIDVDFDVSIARAVERDNVSESRPDDIESLKQKYIQRYVGGQKIYLQEVMPKKLATIIIDNNHLQNPYLTT